MVWKFSVDINLCNRFIVVVVLCERCINEIIGVSIRVSVNIYNIWVLL